MADWEQPSTTLSRVSGEGDDPIQVLRSELANALNRIAALEERVNALEGGRQTHRGQTQGV